MAFIPITWKSGDVITPKKLNRLENAVNNSLIVEGTTSGGQTTLNATYNDIYNAIEMGKNVIIKNGNIYENVVFGKFYGPSMNECYITTGNNSYGASSIDEPLVCSEIN